MGEYVVGGAFGNPDPCPYIHIFLHIILSSSAILTGVKKRKSCRDDAFTVKEDVTELAESPQKTRTEMLLFLILRFVAIRLIISSNGKCRTPSLPSFQTSFPLCSWVTVA
jgi:hypothetical protein